MNDLTSKYVGVNSYHNPNLRFLENEIGNYRILVMQGGTRSGKTYSGVQFIWRNMHKYTGVEYSIVRQSFPALSSTVMKDFIHIGADAGLYLEANHHITNKEYKHNGNVLDYFSAEDHEKIRGRKRHVLYMNEAPELDWKVVEQLLWRTESKIIMDYNPSYPESWMYDKILTRKDCAFIITTYEDNPHLSKGQLDEILWMKENDPDTYRVYGLGQRGELRGQIYKNWKRIDALPIEFPSTFVIDWGYANDPACIGEFKHNKRAIYSKQHLYQTGLHNVHLAIKLVMVGCDSNTPIIADNAEPKAIAELRNRLHTVSKETIKEDALLLEYDLSDKEVDKIYDVFQEGFSISGCLKQEIEVDIQKVKQYEIFVTEDSKDAWREYYQYRWKEDPKTGKLLNVPVGQDHYQDCAKYFAASLY